MKKFLNIIIIILILIAGYFLFFYNPQDSKEVTNNFEDVDVQIRDMSNVPAEYYSGNSRYSYGECQQDSDCNVIGCTSEMCSADPNLMTTCEINADFPDKNIYACGCIKDICGWYKK